MIRKPKNTGIVINLDGSEGNAYVLMGIAQNIAKLLDYDPDERDKLIADMKSGDYNHLIMVFEKHFGDYVTLETKQEQLLNLFDNEI